MFGNLFKKGVVVLLGLVLAILLRVITTYSLMFGGYQFTADVVSYYIAITSAVSVMVFLFAVSIFLAYLTNDWIILGSLGKRYEALMDGIAKKWLDFINDNETHWTALEKKMRCCGLEGPRSYMDYMLRVPGHCYSPGLITLGCSHKVENIFNPLLNLGGLVLKLMVFLELGIFLYYALRIFRKFFGVIGKKREQKSFGQATRYKYPFMYNNKTI
ncbi:uncharacterized protein LOC108114803 [Drosophila eugracilis]|uniref:uncharacterized protein LOC108114803 n=1 Tax=Drosophila eugracilis TaxID=29029 RepID=UPI001BDB4351|nr:uncharacterized protein LOC108114803 [Drosophila eugracilis]